MANSKQDYDKRVRKLVDYLNDNQITVGQAFLMNVAVDLVHIARMAQEEGCLHEGLPMRTALVLGCIAGTAKDLEEAIIREFPPDVRECLDSLLEAKEEES